MLEKILGALLPAILTILIGYAAAWHHDFQQKEVPTLNRMVMHYALPLALFVGVVSAGREELFAELLLIAFLAAAFFGMYLFVFVLAIYVFHHPIGLSSLRALTASAPSTAFVGTPVLGYLYGATGDIPIAVGSIIIVVGLVPITMILLSLDPPTQPDATHPQQAAGPSAEKTSVFSKVLSALKQPVVWLPFLGFMFVVLDFHLPKVVEESLSLLGHSASGVALFTSGIILAGYRIMVTRPVVILVFLKNVVQPGLVCAGMLVLGYGNPLLGQTVVTTALPAVTLVVMLAVQYRVAIPETASALLISTFGSILTMSAFIWFLL